MVLKALLVAAAAWAVRALPIIEQRQVLDEYDYIVIGGGPGGMTVANRLSEDPSKRVILFEAGPLHNYEREIMVPRWQIFGALYLNYQWNTLSTPQEGLVASRPVPIEQGRVLGGGSSLNVMVWGRGTRVEYDHWKEFGNPGWGWDGLLPYFKKAEATTPPGPGEAGYGLNYDPSCHGTGGPVQNGYNNYHYPQNKNFLDGMRRLGIQQTQEQMCGNSLGSTMTLHSIDHANQSRADARVSYYDPIFAPGGTPRPNLHVLIEHTVTKILTTATNGVVSAIGVEYAASKLDSLKTVHLAAGGEVIVAGGALQTPKLLLLSGIGDKAELDKVGIATVLDLPGVGANLHDHAGAPSLGGLAPGVPSIYDITLNPILDAQAGREYYASRTGRWTESGDSVAFMPFLNYTSRPNDAPSIIEEMLPDNAVEHLKPGTHPTVVAGYRRMAQAIHDMAAARTGAGAELIWFLGGVEMVSTLMNPLSRGTVRLPSKDPWDANPLVDPRYLTHPSDAKMIVECVRLIRRLIETPEMRAIGLSELTPGPLVLDVGDALETYVRTTLLTAWHPAGSAAMLPKELGGVVDPELKVYGTSNLRVVDASIIPMLPSSHTMATVYAIAEKAADIIKAAAA